MKCSNCPYNSKRWEIKGSEVICPAAHIKVIVWENICVEKGDKK